jgi:nucleotide-binding universal stress UspA family protein
MFRHVVVALDFTEAGQALLRCLPGLGALGARELTLLHVAGIDYPIAGAVAHLDHHRERLAEMAASLEDQGFQVQTQARAGGTAGEILRAAGEVAADLILVGSRGHSRVYEAFIGSVALAVMERSTHPVLLQPLAVEERDDGGPDEQTTVRALCCDLGSRVLFATDFSEAGHRAFAVVEALARGGGHRITLLHSLNAGSPDTPAASTFRARLEDLASRLSRAGAPEVAAVLTFEGPVKGVLEQAAKEPDTLVVMGTQGKGVLDRMALGSVSRAVARQIRCPLLLVPPGPVD